MTQGRWGEGERDGAKTRQERNVGNRGGRRGGQRTHLEGWRALDRIRHVREGGVRERHSRERTTRRDGELRVVDVRLLHAHVQRVFVRRVVPRRLLLRRQRLTGGLGALRGVQGKGS